MPSPVTFIGSSLSKTDILNTETNVYVIVHGQKDLLGRVTSALVLKGFKYESIQMARLDEAGRVGDYVAMVWPPGRPREIIVSKIVENTQSQSIPSAPGAWEGIKQSELYRIAL